MAAELTSFDYVVLGAILLFAVLGLWRGFVQESLNLGAWVAGAFAVRFFHETVTFWLTPKVGGETAAAILAFLLLFVGVMLLVRTLAALIGGLSRRSAFGPVDRVLGLGLGALKGVILVSAAFLLVQFGTGILTPGHVTPEWVARSRSAPLLSFTSDAMVGWVKDLRDLQGAEPADDADFQGGYLPGDREALDQLLDGKGGIDI